MAIETLKAEPYGEVCPVLGCERLKQRLSTKKNDGHSSFFKTCVKHTYKDLEAQQKPAK